MVYAAVREAAASVWAAWYRKAVAGNASGRSTFRRVVLFTRAALASISAGPIGSVATPRPRASAWVRTSRYQSRRIRLAALYRTTVTSRSASKAPSSRAC